MKGQVQTKLNNWKKAVLVVPAVVSLLFFPVVWAEPTGSPTPAYNNKFYRKHVEIHQLSFLKKDNAGILKSTKEQLESWQTKKAYLDSWNMESTGIYKVPSHKQQASFVGGRFMRYFDKWISEEAKKDDASAFKKAHKMQRTLSPKKRFSLSDKFKLSFRTHLLRARAFMILENNYFDYVATASPSRGMDIRVGKSLGKNGLRTDINYNLKGRWEASVKRPITRNLYARLSSAYGYGHTAFSKAANNIVQLLYNKGF